MIYHSCVFSLSAQQLAQKNEYIYMLMMLYSTLKRVSSIAEGDIYYLMADEDTAEVIKGIPCLSDLNIILMPKPKTLLEGMAWRYQLHRHIDLVGKSVMYLDVDMLNIKQIRIEIPADLEDVMIVYPEGLNTDTNYTGSGGSLATLAIPMGVSSGFFIYKCGAKVIQFLEEVYHKIRTHTEIYYTLDQPHFNKTIEGKDFCMYMDHATVLFNGHGERKDNTLFINCCGCPGDGAFHFRKMLEILLTPSFRP